MRIMGHDKKNDISAKLHKSEQALSISDEAGQKLSVSDESEQALSASDESGQELSASDESEQKLSDPNESEQAQPDSKEAGHTPPDPTEAEQTLSDSSEGKRTLSDTNDAKQMLLDSDEDLTDEEYFKKYLAGKNTEELVREQETFTAAVQKELQQATEREIRRLQENPETAGQEPTPDLLDRILVGMEVIREREGTETDRGESTEFHREGCSKQETLRETGKMEEEIATGQGKSGRNPQKLAGCHGIRRNALGRKSEHTERLGEAEETSESEIQDGYNPEAYLSEEDRRALEIGRRRLRGSKHRRMRRSLGAVAAIFACVLVVSISSEANRERLVNAFYVLVGQEILTKVNNDDKLSELNVKEREAKAKIKEQTGIEPVNFLYFTKELQYSGYEISALANRASMFYQYQDTIFTVMMSKKEDRTVRGEILDGDISETFLINTKIGEIKTLELEADLEYKYVTEFVHENSYYKIFGALPKEEYVKIIESIFF